MTLTLLYVLFFRLFWPLTCIVVMDFFHGSWPCLFRNNHKSPLLVMFVCFLFMWFLVCWPAAEKHFVYTLSVFDVNSRDFYESCVVYFVTVQVSNYKHSLTMVLNMASHVSTYGYLCNVPLCCIFYISLDNQT